MISMVARYNMSHDSRQMSWVLTVNVADFAVLVFQFPCPGHGQVRAHR